MILEILSLFRLQNMLKLGNSLPGKHTLERKVKGEDGTLSFASASERTKKTVVLSHTEGSLERLGVCSCVSSAISAEAKTGM